MNYININVHTTTKIRPLPDLCNAYANLVFLIECVHSTGNRTLMKTDPEK